MNPLDEPIRELSIEEYNRLRSESENVPLEVVVDETKPVKMGRKIWELALKGDNRDQIAKKLKIATDFLDESLSAYRARLALSIETYRLLDNERVDRLIAYWLPLAMVGSITVEKVRGGEVFREDDFDIPLKASAFCVQTMERRLKILGATAGLLGTESDKPYNERNIVVWLRDVLPSIEKITQELDEGHNGDSPQTNGS
jgi:hypothetical protein